MINNAVQETLCTRCDHRDVCRISAQYQQVLNNVDKITINFGGTEAFLRSLEWCTVDVRCRHYQQKVTMRDEVRRYPTGPGGMDE